MDWASIGAWFKTNPVMAMLALLILRDAAPPVTRLVLALRGKNGHSGNGAAEGNGETTARISGPTEIFPGDCVKRSEIEGFVNRDDLDLAIKAETGPIHWELGSLVTRVGSVEQAVNKHREEFVEMRTETRLSQIAILAGIEEIKTGRTAVEQRLATDLFTGMTKMRAEIEAKLEAKLKGDH